VESQFESIVEALQGKAVLKQHIYRTTMAVFATLKAMAADIAKQLAARMKEKDKTVTVEFSEEGSVEFQLQFGSDVLMFSMQTNVQTFGPEHILSKSPYVLEDPQRGYYGTITIYNFMADSVKYNRLEDAGYLLARMMVNCDGHFYIEGLRNLYFAYPDIATNVIDESVLRLIIESSMLIAIEQDLQAPAYQDVQFIPLGMKLQDQMAGASKVGFQMKTKEPGV
jgi:hypothetical protein